MTTVAPRDAAVPAQAGRQAILRYLDAHGVQCKDAVRPAAAQRIRSAVAAQLDLHGMTQQRAAAALREALERCRCNGQKRLLVIHGQGTHSAPGAGAVLRDLVRMMLAGECAGQIRDYRGASPREGGEGATVVFL